MKKLLNFLPVILLLVFFTIGNRLLASGTVKPTTLIMLSVGLFAVLMISRPKKSGPKPASDLEQQIRGEFAKDAFAGDEKLAAKFQAALKDYSGNMPKAALSKLQKLSSLCTAEEDIYAVAMATALISTSQNKSKDAIREYVRALNIHPTSEIAQALGSCYQRIGELDKARDTYEYALDLDPSNLEALSALATSYVADGKYSMGLQKAMEVLEQNENHASALATAAICHGLLNDPVMHKHYTDRAVENGYKRDKITQTVSALKKG